MAHQNLLHMWCQDDSSEVIETRDIVIFAGLLGLNVLMAFSRLTASDGGHPFPIAPHQGWIRQDTE